MESWCGRSLHRAEPERAEPREPEPQAGPSHASGSPNPWQSSEHSLGQEPNNSSMSLDQEENLQVISTRPGKKVNITAEHAYQTFLLSAETSDIKIRALGKVWCLQKMFLCRSPYFATMFQGSWEQSHKDIIDLDITDPNIDAESLHFVLGSLYRHQHFIAEPLRIPRLLATAHLLQVGNIILQCDEAMKKAINVKTVCSYYAAAETYRLDSVKTACFEWLLHNLITHPSVELYKELGAELMKLLVSSSNLFVMQEEIDVYITLKKWIFLRLNPAWKGSTEELSIHANNWCSSNRQRASELGFLKTAGGIAFQPIFKKLRFQYMFCDLASIRILEQDALIPPEWLSYIYKQQWFTLLRVHECRETGPQVINKIELEEYSLRCGRRIAKNGRYSWTWEGYNFGFPLHVIFTRHYIIFKQNTYSYSCHSSQAQRNIAFRLTLVCFDCTGKVTLSKTTGYKILTFAKDEEQMVMKLDGIALRFPLYIFCNFLFISSDIQEVDDLVD